MRREQRRLAAIVSVDMAGYSRLMGRDESGTLAALKALRREHQIGKVSFRITGGKARTVHIKLSPSFRRLLHRAKKVPIAAFAVTRDAAGNETTSSGVVVEVVVVLGGIVATGTAGLTTYGPPSPISVSFT